MYVRLRNGVYVRHDDIACIVSDKGIVCSPYITKEDAIKSGGDIDKLNIEDYVAIFPHSGWIEAIIGPMFGSRDIIDTYKCKEKGNKLFVEVGWD